MSSSPIVINNDPYQDISSPTSSLSMTPSYTSSESSEEEFCLLNKNSSQSQCLCTSDEQKSSFYRIKRSRNNLSAKRSRVKRRMNDLVLETKLTQLSNENEILRAKIDMLARIFGDSISQTSQQFEPDEITTNGQATVLNILGQSSTQIDHVDNHSLLNPSKQSQLNNTSLPIKWRFKSLNITSDS